MLGPIGFTGSPRCSRPRKPNGVPSYGPGLPVGGSGDPPASARDRGRRTVSAAAAANLRVLRARDGPIVSSRDFHDHLALVVAGGGLPELVAALDGK